MFAFLDLTTLQWCILAFATLIIGIGKTALPGAVTLSVALFAAVIPARESTATMLFLLLAGDIWAVSAYHKSADWTILRKLAPPVVLGVCFGAIVLALINDAGMKKMIGIILLTLTALTLALMKREKTAKRLPTHLSSSGVDTPSSSSQTTFSTSRLARWAYGAIGGFTTMAANSGGPPMNLYFLAYGFDMLRFLGTQAWFFFLVNLLKLPFQISIGLASPLACLRALSLAPALIMGALLGRFLISRIDAALFNPIIIVLTIASSLYLLF